MEWKPEIESSIYTHLVGSQDLDCDVLNRRTSATFWLGYAKSQNSRLFSFLHDHVWAPETSGRDRPGCIKAGMWRDTATRSMLRCHIASMHNTMYSNVFNTYTYIYIYQYQSESTYISQYQTCCRQCQGDSGWTSTWLAWLFVPRTVWPVWVWMQRPSASCD